MATPPPSRGNSMKLLFSPSSRSLCHTLKTHRFCRTSHQVAKTLGQNLDMKTTIATVRRCTEMTARHIHQQVELDSAANYKLVGTWSSMALYIWTSSNSIRCVAHTTDSVSYSVSCESGSHSESEKAGIREPVFPTGDSEIRFASCILPLSRNAG